MNRLKVLSFIGINDLKCLWRFLFNTKILPTLLLLVFFNCSNDDPEDLSGCSQINVSTLSNTQRLFYDIAFDQEFGDDSERLRKWSSNINFFIAGSPTDELIAELNTVVNQINSLDVQYILNEVEEEIDADLIIFFGTTQDYVSLIQPEAEGFAEGARGFTSIFWDNSFQITNASICVDHINFPNIQDLRHVIREELAQSLGLINDTVINDNNIFHQSIQNEAYNNIDLLFIEEMLSNALSPGMCPSQSVQVIP